MTAAMKWIMVLLGVTLLCLPVVGCAAKPGHSDEAELSEGGVVKDSTDVNAPKEIASKNIVSFATRFFVYDKYDDSRSGNYFIEIADNEKGEHVLTVNGVYRHELVVDGRVLEDVQAIIDKHGLVKMNGGGRVTSGLPTEYGPWMLSADYDSGEKLYFYEDGMPDADWTAAFRDYFVALMAEAGFEDVLPPKEAMTIDKFSVAFDIGGEYHYYGLTEFEGSDYLWHHSMDMDAQVETANERAVVTDALLEGLQDVILANGMDALHAPGSVNSDLNGSKDGFLEIYIDYVSGRQIYGEYAGEELPEEWPAMRAALVEYLDNYIRENEADAG